MHDRLPDATPTIVASRFSPRRRCSDSDDERRLFFGKAGSVSRENEELKAEVARLRDRVALLEGELFIFRETLRCLTARPPLPLDR